MTDHRATVLATFLRWEQEQPDKVFLTQPTPDGRVIEPDDVLGSEILGAKLVFVGDAGRTHNLVEVAQEADALVIEATYIQADAEMAQKFGHLTAAQAAKLARKAKVSKLYLTHLSRRYREQEVLEEAQAIFPETMVVRDFDRIKVLREK